MQGACESLPLSLLQSATDNWSPACKIGSGASGVVFRASDPRAAADKRGGTGREKRGNVGTGNSGQWAVKRMTTSRFKGEAAKISRSFVREVGRDSRLWREGKVEGVEQVSE